MKIGGHQTHSAESEASSNEETQEKVFSERRTSRDEEQTAECQTSHQSISPRTGFQ